MGYSDFFMTKIKGLVFFLNNLEINSLQNFLIV